jgi:molybdenum cofactor cytidylyltransferase
MMSSSSQPRILAIVLAAGISSRMGRPKMLLPYNGHTIIEETVDQVLEAGYDDTVVVVGPEREEIQELLAARPVRIAYNLNYRAGMAGSIKAGVSFIDASAQAFALVLGDQPQITAKTHQLVLANYRKHKKGICAPVLDGQIGHPVIFSMDYKTRMYSLQGDKGARHLVEANRADLAELPLKAPEILKSINTQKDYDGLLKG